MSISCPNCGAENAETATFCNLCLAHMTFEDEATARKDFSDGYLTHYPSSFEEGAPSYENTRETPEAPPVDIGVYGARSGLSYEEEQRDVPYRAAVYPEPGQGPGYERGTRFQPVGPGHAGLPEPAARGYDWITVFYICAQMALVAALISAGLELALSLAGYGVSYQGDFSMKMLAVLLSFLIPVCVAGFGAGYRLGGFGWQAGMLAVGIWALLFRPLYYAVLASTLADRFTFSALFSIVSLAFVFFLFVPLGALFGWLGERRAAAGPGF